MQSLAARLIILMASEFVKYFSKPIIICSFVFELRFDEVCCPATPILAEDDKEVWVFGMFFWIQRLDPVIEDSMEPSRTPQSCGIPEGSWFPAVPHNGCPMQVVLRGALLLFLFKGLHEFFANFIISFNVNVINRLAGQPYWSSHKFYRKHSSPFQIDKVFNIPVLVNQNITRM